MNDIKIISKRISGVLDRINHLSYFRVDDEENIWVCQETGDLCYFDNIENITKELLLENNIIGSYIISQEEGMICLGKVTDIYSETGGDDVELVGEFFTISYAYNFINDSYNFSSELSKTEDENWFLGKEYTWELIITSEKRYLEILNQFDKGDQAFLFEINKLIF